MIIFITMLLSLNLHAQDPHLHRLSTPAYYEKAFGRLENKSNAGQHSWPVNVLSIGHTNASYQNYGSGAPYFHHGLDIRANAGESVLASAAGKVVNIENYMGGPLYWEIAILDDQGFLWQYHHVDRNSMTQEVLSAFKTGARIEAGSKIGEVVKWPITSFGERYHHIHLNILDGQKKFLSPFLFLLPLQDTSVPVINRIGLLKNSRELSGQTVRGEYSIYAEISDLVHHDKFIVPPHSIEIEIDGAAPHVVWLFESLPGGANEEALVDDFYVPSMACGDYSCRRPVIDLGFQFKLPVASGRHKLILKASDFAGNTTVRDFEWNVESF
ncbi:MAG: M23 family metallopeptidase [Bacteriovoracaceae bacterium]|nr:M23 family metallopeptidase [Bacteriovoracaceae bacterium]